MMNRTSRRRRTFGGRSGVWWKIHPTRLSIGSATSKDTVKTARLSLGSSVASSPSSPNGDEEEYLTSSGITPLPLVRGVCSLSDVSSVEHDAIGYTESSPGEGSHDDSGSAVDHDDRIITLQSIDHFDMNQNPPKDVHQAIDPLPVLRGLCSPTAGSSFHAKHCNDTDWNMVNDDDLAAWEDGMEMTKRSRNDYLDWSNVSDHNVSSVEEESGNVGENSDHEQEDDPRVADTAATIGSPSTWAQPKRQRQFGGKIRFMKQSKINQEQIKLAKSCIVKAQIATGLGIETKSKPLKRAAGRKRKTDDMSTPRTQKEIKYFRNRFEHIDKEITLKVERVNNKQGPITRPRRQAKKKLNLL